jgi:hypothetical protein
MALSIVETTTTLAANTPALIAAACSNPKLFIMGNNGTGALVWKCGSAPTSATDGTALDPGSTVGGQGGSIVLQYDMAIGDSIWAWSTAGTTVNVKQGFLI